MRVTTPIGITLDLRPDWCDVTDDLSGENVPFTLGREQGSGALQFSAGIYRSGQVPDPSPQDLHRLLCDFAVARGLGEPSNVQTEAAPVRLAAASFRPDFFVRVWYISDGTSVAMVHRHTVGEQLQSAEELLIFPFGSGYSRFIGRAQFFNKDSFHTPLVVF